MTTKEIKEVIKTNLKPSLAIVEMIKTNSDGITSLTIAKQTKMSKEKVRTTLTRIIKKDNGIRRKKEKRFGDTRRQFYYYPIYLSKRKGGISSHAHLISVRYGVMRRHAREKNKRLRLFLLGVGQNLGLSPNLFVLRR